MQALEEIADSEENSRIRAEIWSDFVGWDDRRRGENGFLLKQLKRFNVKTVLDAAPGDGVDTTYLLNRGYNVSANEVDEPFRQKTVENAKKAGFDIEPTNLDWRALTKTYQENSFDAIICLGNSLTCLFGKENMLAALKEFNKVLKDGGVLLVDERNYQKILDNREAALNGELHSSGKYLYTGTDKVKSRFAKVTDDCILIEYNHKQLDKKAYYKVCPLRRNEFKNLLSEAGFNRIEKYSDYEEKDNPESDFNQYVCVK